MIHSFQEYSDAARKFEFYPKDLSVAYLILGLTGEAGELANKYKKVLRDENGELSEERLKEMRGEASDILWYLDRLAEVLGTNLQQIANDNIEKLTDRTRRGVVGGSGDNR